MFFIKSKLYYLPTNVENKMEHLLKELMRGRCLGDYRISHKLIHHIFFLGMPSYKTCDVKICAM